MPRPLAAVALLLLFGNGAAAQGLMTTPIGFRSGLTEGAVTTLPGTLTIDAGASVRWSGAVATLRVGELNVRVPFNRRLEARVYANSIAWRDEAGDVIAGREDASFAAAATVTTHRGLRPVAALILRVDAPTGTLPGRERTWRPSGR
jgi:hypothetical protein